MSTLQILKFPLIISALCLLSTISCEAPPTTNVEQSPALKTQPTTAIKNTVETDLNVNHSEEIESLRKRLVDAYANYWPLISTENQHQQLPSVLGDPMQELRAFGVDRVGVLLRDGDATDEELQLVVDRLNDTSPIVRLAAAKLLVEINVPGLREHVAKSLANETNQAVVHEELLFFQTNPHISAVEPTINILISNPNGSAAKTLIALLKNVQVTDATLEKIINAIKQSRRASNLPDLITLEAMLGDINTKKRLVYLLDSSSEQLKIAVAIGFASSGFSEPLIQRANDPELYLYALDALQKHADINAFKELLNLRKKDNATWQAAVFSIATSLNTRELLRADDMLKRTEELDGLRLSILSSIWKNASEKSLAARKAIARRAVPLMFENNDDVGVLQLLDGFGESLIDEDLITYRFTAAINMLAWGAAADARPDPNVWIATWEVMLTKNPADADVLKKQILHRFKDQLSNEQLLLIGVVPEPPTSEDLSQ
ncbi:MAG TPA: hypothetical protein EYN11_01545 [Phycisphaerales bacterium]|nr:hypothetical protein [Phycisphaerales bacterium]